MREPLLSMAVNGNVAGMAFSPRDREVLRGDQRRLVASGEPGT